MAVVERWKPILGFESRYEVSNLGRVKSLSFMQRYLLRTGAEAYRRTKERVVAQQGINSGYLIVHLHLDNVRVAKLVHRLVAVNFVPGFDLGREVNHKDGNKKHNGATNLEWTTRKANLQHAVAAGLVPRAVRVIDPNDGVIYPSIAQAAKGAKKAHRTVRRTFARVKV